MIKIITKKLDWKPTNKELFPVIDFLRGEIHSAYCLYNDKLNSTFTFYRHKYNRQMLGEAKLVTATGDAIWSTDGLDSTEIIAVVDQLKTPAKLTNPCTEIKWHDGGLAVKEDGKIEPWKPPAPTPYEKVVDGWELWKQKAIEEAYMTPPKIDPIKFDVDCFKSMVPENWEPLKPKF